MDGITRSPNSLPEDRVQMVDDPIRQRGKIVRIHFQAGRQLPHLGRHPAAQLVLRRQGYTVRPGTTVSVAWGFMWENPSMGSHFAQIIREGGPLWMFGVDGGGNMQR